MPRKCVGERLAVATTYLFVCSLLQAFSFHMVPSQPLNIDDYVLNGVMAVPKPVEIEIRPRY